MTNVIFLPKVEGKRTFEFEIALKTRSKEVAFPFLEQLLNYDFLMFFSEQLLNCNFFKGDKKAELGLWSGRRPTGAVFLLCWIFCNSKQGRPSTGRFFRSHFFYPFLPLFFSFLGQSGGGWDCGGDFAVWTAVPEDHLLRGQVVDQLRGGDQQREVSDGKQRLLGQHGGGFVIQKKSFKIYKLLFHKKLYASFGQHGHVDEDLWSEKESRKKSYYRTIQRNIYAQDEVLGNYIFVLIQKDFCSSINL